MCASVDVTDGCWLATALALGVYGEQVAIPGPQGVSELRRALENTEQRHQDPEP